jgi:uncharacterized protein YkwD
MHKRTIDVFRLLSPVLLTLLLLFPSHAGAAGFAAGLAGPEQPEAPFEPSDLPNLDDLSDVGYVYTVVAGDDVWLIAIAHGISMETLAAANHMEPPYLIHPGDRLWVPAVPAVVTHPKPAPPPAPELPQPEPAAAAEVAAAPALTATVETVVTATATTDSVAPAPEPAAEPANLAASRLSDGQTLILALINEKRTAYGLAALEWSPVLAQAAEGHAIDLAQRGWGSHVGSDGARLRTRLSRAGYYASWASENWANSRNAQHAFDMWWYEGPGGPHYENILGPNYTEIGIALAKGGWGYYVVADFGSQ